MFVSFVNIILVVTLVLCLKHLYSAFFILSLLVHDLQPFGATQVSECLKIMCNYTCDNFACTCNTTFFSLNVAAIVKL